MPALKNAIEDRRLFERFTSRLPAKFKDTRQEFGETLNIRDASAQGLRMISQERLYVNDRVALEVKLPDNKPPLNLKGEVVWVRNLDDAHWEIGLKFHKVDFLYLSRLYNFAVSVAS